MRSPKIRLAIALHLKIIAVLIAYQFSHVFLTKMLLFCSTSANVAPYRTDIYAVIERFFRKIVLSLQPKLFLLDLVTQNAFSTELMDHTMFYCYRKSREKYRTPHLLNPLVHKANFQLQPLGSLRPQEEIKK